MSPSSSAASRPRCAGSPTTTTTAIWSAVPSSSMPRPTSCVYGMGEQQSRIARRLHAGESIRDDGHRRHRLGDLPGRHPPERASPSLPMRRSLRVTSAQHPDRTRQARIRPNYSEHLRRRTPSREGGHPTERGPPSYRTLRPPLRGVGCPLQFPTHWTPTPTMRRRGGVPALTELQFSLTSNRGCFGSLLLLRHRVIRGG